MIEVRQRRDLWTFAVLFTSLEIAFLMIVQVLYYPPEMRAYVLAREPLITLIVSLPVCLYLGGQMHENYLRRQELKSLTQRDRLTQAATRDFFYERLAEEPDAYGVSLMVDIDFFKKVNDTHGHLVGDAVIKSVAEILRANCRDVDIVCRFGGEEFVIFLHRVSPEQGYDIAERMRRSVESAPVRAEGATVAVTVSIGGSLKDTADDIDASIGDADIALYQAKETGRNRAVMQWMTPQAA